MNTSILVISFCCLLFDVYTVKKIIKGKDLDLIDLLSVMYSVYFVITPIKCALTDTQFYGIDTLFIINKSVEAYQIIFVLKLLFFVINCFLTSKSSYYSKYNFIA